MGRRLLIHSIKQILTLLFMENIKNYAKCAILKTIRRFILYYMFGKLDLDQFEKEMHILKEHTL